METKSPTLSALKVVFIIVGAFVTIGTLAIVAYKLFKKYCNVTFECDCDDCDCDCCEGECDCECCCEAEEDRGT